MTADDLIALLTALPAEQRALEVRAVDCDAGEFAIGSVLALGADEGSCAHQAASPTAARLVLAAARSRGCPWCAVEPATESKTPSTAVKR